MDYLVETLVSAPAFCLGNAVDSGFCLRGIRFCKWLRRNVVPFLRNMPVESRRIILLPISGVVSFSQGGGGGVVTFLYFFFIDTPKSVLKYPFKLEKKAHEQVSLLLFLFFVISFFFLVACGRQTYCIPRSDLQNKGVG